MVNNTKYIYVTTLQSVSQNTNIYNLEIHSSNNWSFKVMILAVAFCNQKCCEGRAEN